jgi:serine protease Do
MPLNEALKDHPRGSDAARHSYGVGKQGRIMITDYKRRMRAIVEVLMILFLALLEPRPAGSALGVEADEQQAVKIYTKVVSATVFLSSSFTTGPVTGKSMGTGFIVDDSGTVITNAHVVGGARNISAQLYDGQKVKVEIIGVDYYSDVAVLKLTGFTGKLSKVDLGSSDNLRIGQRAFVIGNPYGLGFGLSTGILSGLDRTTTSVNFTEPRVALLQTTAPVNHGDSGGPLLNSDGRVIGVTTSILEGTQNIGFAIPINIVKEIVLELKMTGRVRRPWLGIAGKFITEDIRDLFVLPLTNGMLIETVVLDSPAAEAGLRAGTIDVVVSGQPWMMGGDILIAVRGTRMSTVQDFLAVLKELNIGQTVDIEFIRNRERLKTVLTVQERPQVPYNQFVRPLDVQRQGR